MLFKNIIFHEETPKKKREKKNAMRINEANLLAFKNIFTREHGIWPLLKLFVQFPVPQWGY